MIKTIECKAVGEKYYELVHKSGLRILYMPKVGKNKKSAMIATKYGSINSEFKIDGEFKTVPDGTAHFLEHKLFEGEKGNAFDLYAKTGAKANAYTTFDKTTYYFSCTDKFYENLEVLLSYISSPYLTYENVEKEKGIIAQEIKMYDDEPDWQGFMGMVSGLYRNHPVNKDIAGRVEDIMQLDVETLTDVYRTFYTPSNMVLCLAGDMQLEKVTDLCDKYFKEGKTTIAEQIIPDEPAGVATDMLEKEMLVSKPIFFIGIKDNDTKLSGAGLAKKQMECEMLFEMLFGKSTHFYKQLYKSGLINTTFDFEYDMSDTFAFCIITAQSNQPLEVYQKIKEAIEQFLAKDIDDEQFLQIRNLLYGRLVQENDDVSNIVNRMTGNALMGCTMFDNITALTKITKNDLMQRAKMLFVPLNSTISIIWPKKGV